MWASSQWLASRWAALWAALWLSQRGAPPSGDPTVLTDSMGNVLTASDGSTVLTL